MIRALLFLASCSAVVAFVPPAQQSSVKFQAPAARAQEKVDEASSPFSSVVFGASVGYAAAAVGAAARQGRVTRFAEGDAPAVARTCRQSSRELGKTGVVSFCCDSCCLMRGLPWPTRSSLSAGSPSMPWWCPRCSSSVRSAPCSSSSAEPFCNRFPRTRVFAALGTC